MDISWTICRPNAYKNMLHSNGLMRLLHKAFIILRLEIHLVRSLIFIFNWIMHLNIKFAYMYMYLYYFNILYLEILLMNIFFYTFSVACPSGDSSVDAHRT